MKELSRREKTLIGVCIGTAFFYLVYVQIFEPFILNNESSGDEIMQVEKLLIKTKLLVSQKSYHEKILQDVLAKRKELLKHFLPGNKIPVAAAKLQQAIEATAKESGVTILSEKILPEEEIGDLRVIPVQISARGLISSLRDMLFGVENSPFWLNIVKMDIRILSRNNPKEVKAVFVVEGVLLAENDEKPLKKDEGKKKVRRRTGKKGKAKKL